MNNFCWLLLAVLGISVVLQPAGATDEPNDMIINKTDKSLTLIDEAGRTVTVSLPVKRIISGDYRQMEALLAIGAKDMIVGVDSNFHHQMPYFGLKDLPEIGKHAAELNYEQLALLHADIIMLPLWQGSKAKEITENMPNATVVVLGLSSRDTLIPELQIMGQLLGKESEADKLIKWIKKYDGIVEERTKDLKPQNTPTFFYEYMSDLNTKWSAISPSDPSAGRAAEGCGGRNVASDLKLNMTTGEVGAEWVLAQNPDFIFLDFMGGDRSGPEKTKEDVKTELMKIIEERSTEGFSNFTAVKDNHIYVVNRDFVSGPRWVIGHVYIAKWLHPDIFEDLSPDEMNKEYLKEFQGIELEGTWVYPPQ